MQSEVEAHFDESGTDADEMTLAGYIFETQRMEAFKREWSLLLEQHGLPYFHMVDCAHGKRAP